LLRLFNWIPLAHENWAYAVAFGPSIVSVGFGVCVIYLSRENPHKKYIRLGVSGILLSIGGFVITIFAANLNWPYGSH